MAECVVAVVIAVMSKIAEYSVVPIGKRIGYLFCYNNNIANMKSQFQELDVGMGTLQQRINTDEYNAQVIEDHVLRWQEEANEKKEEVYKILEDQKEVGKGCWNGWCLNLKSRYSLSRKATKETRDLIELVRKRSSFTSISHPAPPPGIVSSSSAQGTSQGGYMELDTRRSIMSDVIKALKDDAIHKIGIWGMPGVGKTTLANEVLNKAIKEHFFDEVAMAVVSQKPNFTGIQDSIAEYLGVKFDECNSIGRRHRLRTRLAQVGKRKLIVLDDVWKRLNLDEIGIPYGDDMKGCTIMLTTREKDVCDQMSVTSTFQLAVLDKEEARHLFKSKVDYSYFHRDWRSTAKGIVDKCGGLPLAITTIATTLINKDEATWADVLRQLQNANNANVYEVLKVSYDFLETEEIKKFFLLCCLFREDSSIPIEELLRYGVGLKLFDDPNDLHEARNQAYAHVRKLHDSNLLLASDEGYVKMHDLMRDFAIWITSSGKHVKGWPWPRPMEDSYSGSSISLEVDISYQLPNRLRCPNLELLRLVNQNASYGLSHWELPEGFFEGMGKLQVMALGGMVVQSLPEGLISLRTLSLSYCQLKGDVSIIGNLQSLEILSFADSDIEELPREIGKLTRLRLLDLTNCRKLRTIAAGVLPSLTCLEELYMRGIAFKWKEEVGASSQEDESRASFNDLKKLAKLTALEIDIPYEVSPTGLIFNNLKKFNISVAGDGDDDFTFGPWFGYVGNRLVLRADKSVLVEGFINRLCSKAVYLCLVVKDLKSLPEELEREGFFKLRSLKLVSCGGLVSIVNKMGQYTANVFPKLESLYLHNLGNLEVLCHGQHSKQGSCLPSSSMNQLVSFGKLKNLELRGCNKLKSIFSLSIAHNLINLEELKIKECQMMEEIISEERGDPDESAVVSRIVFLRLKRLELERLPNLVAFSKALVEVELPQLEVMILRGLTMVTSLYPGGETLASENDQHCLFKHKVTLGSVAAVTEIQPAQDPDDSFSKLRWIEVRNCERLLNIFPSSMIQQLQNLQHLKVSDCSSVEVVFDLKGSNSEEGREVEVHVTRGLQNLTQLTITGCDSLETIFSASTARVLVMLQSLEITKCQMLEAIFSNGGGELPKLERLKLVDLPNLVGLCDSVFEVELPQLEDLRLERVPKFGGIYQETQISGSKQHHASPERPSFKPMVTLTNMVKQLQNLQKLGVVECDSLRQLFTTSMAKILVNLKNIEIADCKLLEAIVAKEEEGREEEEEEDCSKLLEAILFPQLTALELRGLPKLLTIVPKAYTFNWSSITTLKVVDCGRGAEALLSPKEVDNLNNMCERGTTVAALKSSEVIQQLQNLEFLELGNLNSIELVFSLQGPPSTIQGFQNMKQLRINECDSLRHLFTSSMAKILVELEILEVSDCKLLEAIVAEEEEEGGEEGILFPKLKYLYLKGLPNLLTVIPRNFNCSSLIDLTIKDCGRGAEAPLNDDKLYEGDQQVTSSCSRGTLQVSKTVFVIPSLHELFSVEIEKCSSVEVVFDLQGLIDVNQGRQLLLAPQLQYITLICLPKLTNIWKRVPHNIQGFQKLKSLEVKGCDDLRYLFTPSMAKILVGLEELKISECKLLEAIVAKEEEGIEEEEEEEEEVILFPKLTYLYLIGLPNLMTITPKAYRVDWTNMKALIVDRCGEGAADTLTPIILNLQRVALATSTTTEPVRTWPELVGLPTEEAVSKVMKGMWDKTVVVSEHALIYTSYGTEQVLIVIDSSGKVIRPPLYYGRINIW